MGEATIWVPNMVILREQYGKRFQFLDEQAVEFALNGAGRVEAEVFDKQTGRQYTLTVRRSD